MSGIRTREQIQKACREAEDTARCLRFLQQIWPLLEDLPEVGDVAEMIDRWSSLEYSDARNGVVAWITSRWKRHEIPTEVYGRLYTATSAEIGRAYTTVFWGSVQGSRVAEPGQPAGG